MNALQRHAAVVVQKSLHEGFGLTVTEAMWKARPDRRQRRGRHPGPDRGRQHGLLLEDPRDLDAFAAALRGLLEDSERARSSLGEARPRARARATSSASGTCSQYAELTEELLDKPV